MAKNKLFTPETLLGSPRRSSGIPNRLGSHALYTVSTHEWGGKTRKEVHAMDLKTSQSTQISNDEDVSDASWIPGTDEEIIYLKGCKNGLIQIYVTTVEQNNPGSRQNHVQVAEVEAPIANLKMHELQDGSIAMLVTGLVGDSGELLNYEDEERRPKSSARVYDTANVRAWNQYCRQQRYSLWYTTLVKSDGVYRTSGQLHNLIGSDTLEAPCGIYDTRDPKDYFDVCQKGVAFLARDLAKERDFEACCAVYPYFIALDSFADPPSHQPKSISVNGDFIYRKSGSKSGDGIQFSPDGSRIAFLYGTDRDTYSNRLFLAEVQSLYAVDVLEQITGAELRDIDPPTSFKFSGSSDSMILLSMKRGQMVMSLLALSKGEQPRVLHETSSIAGFYPLKEGDYSELLISSNSFVESSLWQIFSLREGQSTRAVSSMTDQGRLYGISMNQVTELWFKGSDGLDMQSFIFYPSNFKETKKYPWLLLPHGGPVGCWQNSWSTRWNMLLWAEQGFVVIAPNVSGSTGFGTSFAARIQGQYGGYPFEDLLCLIPYLEKLPYLDPGKGIVAGGSYGAYLVSRVLGHEVSRKFCGAIWHDGVLSTSLMFYIMDYASDDGWFGDKPPYLWNNNEQLQRWNPATPARLANWERAPPTLIIHSDKDYRCPITDGLAAFRVLQAFGVPSRFLTFEDEGHWVLRPENALSWYRFIFDWAERCTSGELTRPDVSSSK